MLLLKDLKLISIFLNGGLRNLENENSGSCESRYVPSQRETHSYFYAHFSKNIKVWSSKFTMAENIKEATPWAVWDRWAQGAWSVCIGRVVDHWALHEDHQNGEVQDRGETCTRYKVNSQSGDFCSTQKTWRAGTWCLGCLFNVSSPINLINILGGAAPRERSPRLPGFVVWDKMIIG